MSSGTPSRTGLAQGAGGADVHRANVYPGVDLVYCINGKQVEYEFVAAPGASPNHLRPNLPETEEAPGRFLVAPTRGAARNGKG